MKAIVLAVVAWSLVVAGSWQGLLAQSGDQRAVQEAVEAFLLHLGDGEFDKVAADLAPKSIVIVTRERDGRWSNTFQTGDEWLAALRSNDRFQKFREPLANLHVTIDRDAGGGDRAGSGLAYERADFQVVREGTVLSHGVDQFTLVSEDGRWKVAAVAYTSIAGK